MSYSKVAAVVTPKNRPILAGISWKTWAVLSVPVFLAGAAGSYYVYRQYKRSGYESLVDLTDTVQDKTPLEIAMSRKNKGNQYFKVGQYQRAMELYGEGLEICPEEAVVERAALHQNRAAAKEHLKMYKSAVEDCSLALEMQPRYLKALNRRAHLYEKLDNMDECLLDVVACCILEEFKVPSNINLMGHVLKTLGEQKAEKEMANISPSLPSATFVRNYLNAYAWDPFACSSEKKSPVPTSGLVNGVVVNGTTNGIEDSGSLVKELSPPGRFQAARERLQQALECMPNEEYERSMELVRQAVDMFEQALQLTDGLWKSVEEVKPSAVEPTATSGDQEVRVQDLPGGETDDLTGKPSTTTTTNEELRGDQLEFNRARLLHATYLSLVGQSKKAVELLRFISAEDSGADAVMRVNALVKLASISMSVNEDIETCLHTFKKAQDHCPDCPDIYLHRGQINLLAGRLEEAQEDFDKAVRLQPDFSINQAERLFTQYRRDLSQSDMDQVSDRVEQFRRLAQKYPKCLETQSLFAQVLSDRGDFEECDKIYENVIQLAPYSGPTYAQRGILHLRWKQDREAACKWFSRGAEVDPKCELIQELLGQLAVESGDLDQALSHFKQAVEQAKTRHDLAHLIALRDSVIAQRTVCARYNIPIQEVLAAVKREQMLAFGQ